MSGDASPSEGKATVLVRFFLTAIVVGAYLGLLSTDVSLAEKSLYFLPVIACIAATVDGYRSSVGLPRSRKVAVSCTVMISVFAVAALILRLWRS